MPKPKKCRMCKEPFTPMRSLQTVCSPLCAITLLNERKEKAFKAETRKLKEKIKTRSAWMKEAQTAFNAYIRERDHALSCISCDIEATKDRRYLSFTGGYFDCGHYRSVGSAPELRFEELNAAKQCKRCNRDLSGNIVEYRSRLIGRIGAEKLEWLEGPHEAKKYSIDDLKEIKGKYRKMANELKKSRLAG